MLDMSWGEVMLIGGVALIVIGPKDLPKALRTVGQITGKLRRMAGEFQHQFNEAVREAELDEARREFDGIRDTVRRTGSGFNPVQTIRDELKGAVEGRQEAARKGAAEPRDAEPQPEPVPHSRGTYDVPRAAEIRTSPEFGPHEPTVPESLPLPLPGSADDPFGTPEPTNPAPASPGGEAKPGTSGR